MYIEINFISNNKKNCFLFFFCISKDNKTIYKQSIYKQSIYKQTNHRTGRKVLQPQYNPSGY